MVVLLEQNEVNKLKKVKIILSLTLCICIIVFSTVTATESLRTLEAYNSYYPVFVNGIQSKEEVIQMLFEDRIYLPMWYISYLLNIDVNWNDAKGTIEITTQNDSELIKDYTISESSATLLSDSYFEEVFGEVFMEKTEITSITETADAYVISRTPKKLTEFKKSGTVHIGKKDGRLMNAG